MLILQKITTLSRFGQEGGDPEIGFDQAADIFCFSLANEIAYTIIFGQGPWSAIRTRGTANAHRESKLLALVKEMRRQLALS